MKKVHTAKRILVVEDDSDLREIMCVALRAAHFTPIEARNGQEGADIAIAQHPDLILLDLMMPVMDGMTALKLIRQDPWGAKALVIILTNVSASSAELVEDVVTHRPLHYLIKSDWEPKDIVKKIAEILEKEGSPN